MKLINRLCAAASGFRYPDDADLAYQLAEQLFTQGMELADERRACAALSNRVAELVIQLDAVQAAALRSNHR